MKRILVVDNNKTIVEMLATQLTAAGYEIDKAYDGMQALDHIKDHPPDLIVLDLIMPKIDGYRLAKYLKSTPDYNHIPIVILTGIAAEDNKQFLDVEAEAFIAKGRIDETVHHLLTTIKWLETRKTSKRRILGLENFQPREMTTELLLVKQHFDSMLQLMGEGVLEIDEHHRVFFANQAACKLLGQSEVELFGRSLPELFPCAGEISPYLERLPKNQKIQKPGIVFPLGDKVISLMATPFFFNQVYIGSIIVLDDITLQVRKEQALEELTSGIIRHAPIGIALLDQDRAIVLANDHFKLLAGAKGDIGRTNILELPNFQAGAFGDLFRQTAPSEPAATASREISFTQDQAHRLKTYHLTTSPLFQQDGLPYLLLLVEDITEKAELERKVLATNRELEAANQAKSNFLSIVSHELRTPLSVIRGYLSLILEGKIEGCTGEALEALQTSNKRARHLQQLIEELLDLSRIEAGKITLKEDVLNLEKHILETVDMFRVDIDRKKLKVEVNLKALPEIVTDHDKIHQIFTNLLSNAIKFTPERGRISITGQAVDGEVRVSVSDTGIGIPEDKISFIFNKFYQVDSTDTRLHGGTGLGLSIVHMILEAMGGRITVESRDGEGSTFTVCLPPGSEGKLKKPPVKQARMTERPKAGQRSRKTVLLCEDDEDTVKIIGYTLASPDFDLVVCRDGFEALQKIFRQNIDLVLVDIRLPLMDGYDFCRMLRAVKTTESLPIIILSAAGQEDEIKRGYESGANEYIIKPFNPAELLERANRYLEAQTD